jgi:hypothetical protein
MTLSEEQASLIVSLRGVARLVPARKPLQLHLRHLHGPFAMQEQLVAVLGEGFAAELGADALSGLGGGGVAVSLSRPGSGGDQGRGEW